MRNKILIIFSLTLFSKFVFSQQSDTLNFNRITFTCSLLEHLPTINAFNYNIGTEIYLKNRNSVTANFGLIRSTGHSGADFITVYSIKTQGYKINLEGRHYLNKHKLFEPAILLFWPHIFQYKSQRLLNSGYYIAIHSSFQQTATNREGDNYNQLNNPDDFYTVNRYVYSLNLKLGYNCVKKCGFTFDYAIGLGGKYISSNSINRIGKDDGWPKNEKDIPWNKLFDNGAGFFPNFIYQIKVGWSFK